MEMESVFGLPLEVITNLSDTSEHLAPDEPLNEKMVFVGGRYQEKHDDVFRLFFLNLTETTKISSQGYVMWHLFVAVLSAFIVFCQIGFALLQSGASRKGSVVIPFVVNILNIGISALAFWSVGYAIARSEGFMALGYKNWFAHDSGSSLSIDWFLYFSLILTTVNIASSGGLERCPLWVTALVSTSMAGRFVSDLFGNHIVGFPTRRLNFIGLLGMFCKFFIAAQPIGVICPFIIRWTWHYSGWMLKYTIGLGVQNQDIGGSGPVHAVGGAAALVVTLVLGSRDEKIRRKGQRGIVYDMEGHSVPLEMLGGYIIFICILCTNVVRSMSAYLGTDPTAAVGRGLMNTIISSAFCCIVTIGLAFLLKRLMGVWRFHWLFTRMIMNSILIGAVAVSGGCTAYSQWACAVIGILASIGYIVWTGVFGFTKVDDVTGSITVHLGGGILGAVCVPLFRQDTGLLFTDNAELAGMCVLWNLVCVLSMVVVTMVIVGLTLALPSMLEKVPLNTLQRLQGMDYHLLKQEGYPNGHIISMYNTDAIEDRETFSDSHTASPASQQAFVNQFAYTPGYENDLVYPPGDLGSGMNGFSDMPYNCGNSLPDVYRDLPGVRDLSFQNTSHDAYTLDRYPGGDRHVWFGGDNIAPEVPMSPFADGHRLQYC